MVPPASPHELLKAILQGAASARPLFVPIVFSHAARIENLPLQAFLANPTKITQALRQVRGHLRSDAMTCYFDPYLEAEALGATLDWGSGNNPVVRWANDPLRGDPPADEIATKGRIPVAVEVIHRLKSVVRDDVLLAVGISGPFRLAAQLMRAEHNEPGHQVSSAALERASEAIAPVAAAFVEAGASLVLIREELPSSVPDSPDLASLLATTTNIVRFYRALPVLILGSAAARQQPVFSQVSDCVVCPTLTEIAPKLPEGLVASAPVALGIAIPVGVISEGGQGIVKFAEEFRRLNPGVKPALITTSEDVPDTADLRNLNRLRDLLMV